MAHSKMIYLLKMGICHMMSNYQRISSTNLAQTHAQCHKFLPSRNRPIVTDEVVIGHVPVFILESHTRDAKGDSTDERWTNIEESCHFCISSPALLVTQLCWNTDNYFPCHLNSPEPHPSGFDSSDRARSIPWFWHVLNIIFSNINDQWSDLREFFIHVSCGKLR